MPDAVPVHVLSLTTTVGSAADARRLAQALLDRRLAACVQVEAGVQSHYRWDGRVQTQAEWRLVVKSTPQHLAGLQAFFAAEHPYQVPQLVWQTLEASPAYAAWVQAATGMA